MFGDSSCGTSFYGQHIDMSHGISISLRRLGEEHVRLAMPGRYARFIELRAAGMLSRFQKGALGGGSVPDVLRRLREQATGSRPKDFVLFSSWQLHGIRGQRH